jgi:hypothetical protein
MHTMWTRMKTHARKRWLLGGLAGMALAVALTGGVALADSGDVTLSRHPLRQAFRQHLESDLGVSDDQLTATVKQAVNETIDDALAQGTLTQPQADELKQRIADGDAGALWGFGRRHPGARIQQTVGADIAKQLGITPAELQKELANGQTLNDSITAHGKTTDEVVNAVISDAQTKLDARESTLLDALRQRLANAIEHNTLPKPNATPTASPTS